MASPRLEVQALSKTYGTLKALHNVSFQLAAGEIVGLVGRRGAGKSTLLHILGGANSASSGRILLDGQPVALTPPSRARRQGIELVYQLPQLVETLGVQQNIFLGREPARYFAGGLLDRGRANRRARELLGEFEMSSAILHMRTADLSDEQRQVIALARAFDRPARLLLLDDLLGNLSFTRQEIVLRKLRRQADEGVAVVISSENLKHLFALTDRILVLYQGRLIADRRTANTTQRDIVELIVGIGNRDQVTPVIWALESYHAAQRQTEELFQMQTVLHHNLEASDSLNRELVERLSEQVKALDTLNAALQQTQRRLLTEREEERRALARELHDVVIQDLLSLNYQLEGIEDDTTDAVFSRELRAIQHGVRQAVSDLRQVCRDLRPPTIDNHGLFSAIRSLAQEWEERTGIAVETQVDPDVGRLPEATEISIFRIIQEGLNNVGKHADAANVRLTLRRTDSDNLLLQIADDGRGLHLPPDLSDLSARKHFGLIGISERAALLGGKMRIAAAAQGGLVLQVEIPSPNPSA